MIVKQYRIHCQVLLLVMLLCLSRLAARTQGPGYDPGRLYTVKELKEDLKCLKDSLEAKHPALYRYIDKAALRKFLDSLDRSITHPMTEGQFFGLLTLLHGKIGDGHTLLLPGEAAMKYLNSKEKLLPLSVIVSGGRLYIAENWSGDERIHQGEEILAINGVNSRTLLKDLLSRQVRDGWNQTYPVWILSHYFSAHYGFVYGHPGQFDLQLKNLQGATSARQLAALTRDSMRRYRQARYPEHYPSSMAGQGITLKETGDSLTRILTIRSFDSALIRDQYQQDFTSTVDSLFRLLVMQHTGQLILDLRGNQGGDFESGRHLLSWLFLRPARYLTDGPESRLIEPVKQHFTGRLFVLTDGGSFSNSGIVCSSLRREGRALFIGEETGGNKTIISGNAEEVLLPHTRISASISTTGFRILRERDQGHGLLPDHPVRSSVYDLQVGRDAVLERALKLAGAPPAFLDSMTAAIRRAVYPGIHSLLISRGGKLVYEQYFSGFGRDSLHDSRSSFKSVTSLLTGIAIGKGYIKGVEEKVYSFFPAGAAGNHPDERKKNMQIRHLLMMESGYDCEEFFQDDRDCESQMEGSPDWVQFSLGLPMKEAPGREWAYTSCDPVILSGIIRRSAKMPVMEFAQRFLFGPLGITKYRWTIDSAGNGMTGGSFYIRPLDMLKIGELVKQNGVWKGQAIVPASWIRESTQPLVPIPNWSFVKQSRTELAVPQPTQYGYYWYSEEIDSRAYKGKMLFASGNGGQYILILKDLDLVVVFTQGNYGSRKAKQAFDILVRYILPAMTE